MIAFRGLPALGLDRSGTMEVWRNLPGVNPSTGPVQGTMHDLHADAILSNNLSALTLEVSVDALLVHALELTASGYVSGHLRFLPRPGDGRLTPIDQDGRSFPVIP